MSQLEAKATIQILKSPSDVFEAIVDPNKMSNYFISKSTGRMEEGKTLTWWFPEFEDGSEIKVGKIEKDRYISYSWGIESEAHLCEMTLTSREGNTVITVTEKGGENDNDGLNWLRGNTEGWANFLACLKAYVEYGINLRKGAFDFIGDK